LLAFALELLTHHPLPTLAHNDFAHLRLLAEVMRLTNVARAAWEKTDLLVTNPENPYALKVAEYLLAETNIKLYQQQLEAVLAGGRFVPEPTLPKDPPNTTHISAADVTGNVVSLTISAGENAGYIVGDTGLMLNNMLGELDLHPNGFHQLPPGQRLATMMSPVIVLRRGQPILAVGSGGSSRLRSAILQTVSNLVDFGLPLGEAVAAPRLHFEENVVQLEGGIAPEVADGLEATGYTLNRWATRALYFGGAHAVAPLDDKPDRWLGVGDTRRGGAVAVA
jgi:gamma-glutamyltranspeptidase/glutathione hydrolase